VKEVRSGIKPLAGVPGDAWTTLMRLSAWAVVMCENAVIRLTNALAGVPGDAWTTLMRLFDCCVVSAAAPTESGVAKRARESTVATVIFLGSMGYI